MVAPVQAPSFVTWFRQAAPYINAFRGRTFVLAFGGEAVADPGFNHLIHDLALLESLGIRLVVVHGARPQIESRLQQRQAQIRYHGDLRITDATALECVKEASSHVRLEIEALFSMGLANSPMAGARIRAVSGNFVIARPIGIRDGIDHQHTGVVRRIDTEGIQKQLQDGAIVILSPVGFSPTGEVFNLSAEDVAMSAAVSLKADKLIYLSEEPLLDNDGHIVRELSIGAARELLTAGTAIGGARYLRHAIHACEHGIRRVHVLDRQRDGGLLQELFTRDGIGALISADLYEGLRAARLDDIAGILELIRPMEEEGVLVKRSREMLEQEIHHYAVIERDGTIIACAALHPYSEHRMAELAGLAVHNDYRGMGKGHVLYSYIEKQARDMGMKKLFILTTQSSHWFQEKGFTRMELTDLPMKKQELYNLQRRSQPYGKDL